jgi:hypothetical protein
MHPYYDYDSVQVTFDNHAEAANANGRNGLQYAPPYIEIKGGKGTEITFYPSTNGGNNRPSRDSAYTSRR